MEPVKSHRIKLRTLVVLQAVFAALALAFLFTSGWNAYTTGAPLSAAPVVPSIAMFLIYSAFLGHKAHRPASAAFRRATTDHGNQPLFLGSTSHA